MSFKSALKNINMKMKGMQIFNVYFKSSTFCGNKILLIYDLK